MTVSPLRPEHDLGWAVLPLHCLWSPIGLLGQLLVLDALLCVFERHRAIEHPLMSSQRAGGPGYDGQEGREMTLAANFGKSHMRKHESRDV